MRLRFHCVRSHVDEIAFGRRAGHGEIHAQGRLASAFAWRRRSSSQLRQEREVPRRRSNCNSEAARRSENARRMHGQQRRTKLKAGTPGSACWHRGGSYVAKSICRAKGGPRGVRKCSERLACEPRTHKQCHALSFSLCTRRELSMRGPVLVSVPSCKLCGSTRCLRGGIHMPDCSWARTRPRRAANRHARQRR